MRHDPAQRLLRMARLLAGSRAGLTTKDLSEKLGVGPRTIQRDLLTLRDMFYEVEEVKGGERGSRWRMSVRPLGVLATPRPEALATLESVARSLDDAGERDRAGQLRHVAECIAAWLPATQQRRLAPDLEALIEAQGAAMRPGPRPVVSPELLSTLHMAIKRASRLAITYQPPDAPPADHVVCPYGLLRGGRVWLVAPVAGKSEPSLWRLDRIREATLVDQWFEPPKEFTLAAFASRSFGVYQQEPIDVVLRIAPEAAADAEGWVFHPSQKVTPNADGSRTVRFRAGGTWEMCWHFFTWGTGLSIIAPDSLRAEMAAMAQRVATHHAAVPAPDLPAPGDATVGTAFAGSGVNHQTKDVMAAALAGRAR